MGFIETFFKKNPTDIRADDVEGFISTKIEENRNLDYKDIKKYDDFDDLSRHISAFANSLGGLLILGVSEEEEGKGKNRRIYPEKITWGDEALSKERLENKLSARIQPTIRELGIVPIRESKKSSRVIFLIDIPKSDNAPHMASDYRYYRRLDYSRRPMEHYEVADLFKANWLAKEKLIEEIFKPMASILEKQANQFKNYQSVYSHEIQNILANTYYKLQIPGELLERIDDYIDAVSEYNDGLFYARSAVSKIYARNILEFIGKDQQDFKGDVRIDLESVSNDGTVGLNRENIMDLLLKNKPLETYLDKYVYDNSARVHTIVFKYPLKIEDHVSYKTEKLSVKKFVQFIWKKCLREISNDAKISQIKKDAELLIEEAWDLIYEITEY